MVLLRNFCIFLANSNPPPQAAANSLITPFFVGFLSVVSQHLTGPIGARHLQLSPTCWWMSCEKHMMFKGPLDRNDTEKKKQFQKIFFQHPEFMLNSLNSWL